MDRAGSSAHYMERATENTRFNLSLDKIMYTVRGEKGLKQRDVFGVNDWETEVEVLSTVYEDYTSPVPSSSYFPNVPSLPGAGIFGDARSSAASSGTGMLSRLDREIGRGMKILDGADTPVRRTEVKKDNKSK
eukprot:sb/3474907/